MGTRYYYSVLLPTILTVVYRENVLWVLGNLVLVFRRVSDVLVVHPLDFEVKVHVLGTLAQPFFFVF